MCCVSFNLHWFGYFRLLWLSSAVLYLFIYYYFFPPLISEIQWRSNTTIYYMTTYVGFSKALMARPAHFHKVGQNRSFWVDFRGGGILRHIFWTPAPICMPIAWIEPQMNALSAKDMLSPKQHRCTLIRVMENLKFLTFAKLWQIFRGRRQIKCAILYSWSESWSNINHFGYRCPKIRYKFKYINFLAISCEFFCIKLGFNLEIENSGVNLQIHL